MFKLHGGSFLEGATIVSYDLSVALQNWLNYAPTLATQPAGPYRAR